MYWFWRQLVFAVNMDTHSPDLGSVDLASHVLIKNSRDEEISTGFNWDIRDYTSHHPWGYLELAMPSASFFRDVDYIELKIIDMVSIDELSFIWEKEFLEF